MRPGRGIGRRRFLSMLAGHCFTLLPTIAVAARIVRSRGSASPGALGPALSGRILRHAGRSRPIPLDARRLVGLFASLRGATAVGRSYLRDHPGERDIDRLVDRIVPGSGLHSGGWPPKSAIQEVVRARVREDFARGRTVRVERWFLSETEARLCALAFLVQ